MAHTIKHGLYLTTAPDENNKGCIIAVISDGTPQYFHDPVTVLDADRFDSIEAARNWFKKAKLEQPWNPRQ